MQDLLNIIIFLKGFRDFHRRLNLHFRFMMTFGSALGLLLQLLLRRCVLLQERQHLRPEPAAGLHHEGDQRRVRVELRSLISIFSLKLAEHTADF